MVLWSNNFHERGKHDTLNHTQDDKKEYNDKHNSDLLTFYTINFNNYYKDKFSISSKRWFNKTMRLKVNIFLVRFQ